MNNILYIIIIAILIFFVFFREKPIIEGNKKKAKKVESVLDGDKASCASETNPTYTYSSHIKTPSNLHMSTKSKSINKNLSGLSAYTDLLTKGKSKASKKKKPLGGRYFTSSPGQTCYAYDKSTGKCTQQTSTCYTNEVPTDSGDQGLIPGLISDLDILSSSVSSSSSSCSSKETYPACTEVVLSYASDNCMGYGKNYLLNSDINNLDKSLFYAEKTNVYSDAQGGEYPNLAVGYSDENCSASDSSSSSESFSSLQSQDNFDIKIDSTEKYKQYYTSITNKDPIKQLFIMVIGIGGLCLLHKLMYSNRRR